MVLTAIGIMEKAGVGAVLVRNKDNQFTGIFTERDYMRKIALKGLSSKTTTVKAVMTSPPTIVSSSETAIHIMQLMTSRNCTNHYCYQLARSLARFGSRQSLSEAASQ